jgi:hypothetical protein
LNCEEKVLLLEFYREVREVIYTEYSDFTVRNKALITTQLPLYERYFLFDVFPCKA